MVWMSHRIGADGGLHIIDGDDLACQVAVGHRTERLCECLTVATVVAIVGFLLVVRRESLLDGVQVELHVLLHELEDSLSLFGLGGVKDTCRHLRQTTCESLAVYTVIGDTVDGTGTFAAYANLINLYHNTKF